MQRAQEPYASPVVLGEDFTHMRVCLTVRAFVRQAENRGAGRERRRQRALQQLKSIAHINRDAESSGASQSTTYQYTIVHYVDN